MSDFYDRNTELFRETGVRPVVPSAKTEEEGISAAESVITAEDGKENTEKEAVQVQQQEPEDEVDGKSAGTEYLTPAAESGTESGESAQPEESEEIHTAGHRDFPPDFAVTPPSPQTPSKLISADEDLKSSRLKITGINHIEFPVMTIEEDVLVPDVEPDLDQILNVEARPEISSHEMIRNQEGQDAYKIGGSISVNTLYLPVSRSGELISMNSRIDFRRECPLPEEAVRGQSGPGRLPDASETVSADLISVKARVINERKIRISVELRCSVKKYSEEEAEFLEGVRDSELNLRKETIYFTDIAQRRRDTTDISGEIVLKENMPEPGKILNYDVNIAENRRQVGRGKAVVDASAYYSILYMPKSSGNDVSTDFEETGDGDEKMPVFCRGKIDFTQFIKFPDFPVAGDMESRISFDVISTQIDFETPEEGGPQKLMLHASIAASADVFRQIEREIVTDMYHRTKNVDFSTTPRRLSKLCGNGTAEISVREIITLPEEKPGFRNIPYISACAENPQITVENGRCRIEGMIDTNTVYAEEDGEGGFSSYRQELPFRAQLDIPGIDGEMKAEYSCGLKDIWFDRMNARQVEFNCTIFVSVYVWKVESRDFIDRVCYIEEEGAESETAGMVIYVTRPGDTQWSIARKFRTTLQQLRLINSLEESDYVEEGRKLLIL